ncbi:hypothetical protein [Ktedonobacter sp. SOSP1-52]|nr:hypothetical protein [Ktedonobacter sp. SOSP1-52]
MCQTTYLLPDKGLLRNLADSGKKHFRWKRANVLNKPRCFLDGLRSVA